MHTPPGFPTPEQLTRGLISVSRKGNRVEWNGHLTEDEQATLRATFTKEAERAAQEALNRGDSLRRLLSRVDPVQVLSECAALKLSQFSKRDDVQATYGREACMEYIAGVALSLDTRATAPPTSPALMRAWNLAEDVLSLETHQLVMRPPGDETDALSHAQFLLRAEHLMDRMEGFVTHQERAISAVFAPIRGSCRARLGFDPTNMAHVIRAAHQAVQERARPVMRESTRIYGINPDEAGRLLQESSREWFLFAVDELAHRSGLPVAEVSAMLDALASRFGCQPDFRVPSQYNIARRRPFLKLGPDEYLMVMLWSPLHEFVPWFLGLTRERGDTALEHQFTKSRDLATERLARESLAAVFGTSRVAGPLDYCDATDGPTDVDAIVQLAGCALVVEAKAHHLTDPARRGAPARVRRQVGEMLDKALAQGARAERNLRSGTSFVDRKTHQPLAIQRPITDVARIVVSFDRIDPLALTAGLTDEQHSGAWIVSLADLQMLCDLFDDPAVLYAYIRRRIDWSRDDVGLGFMEADFAGAFLLGRLATIERESRDEPELRAMLGYHAADINDYFGSGDVGLHVVKPTVAVPRLVLSALNDLFNKQTSQWGEVACAVLAEPPATWSRFQHAWRRVRSRARGTRLASDLFVGDEGLRLALLASRDGQALDAVESETRQSQASLGIAQRRSDRAIAAAAQTAG
jgi:hypothetical protein